MSVRRDGPGRAVLAYNAGRLALLIVCLVLGRLAGLGGIALFAAALLVSGVLSWFVLGRQRVAMAAAVQRRLENGRRRVSARTAQEDAYVDELMAQDQPDQVDHTA